MSRGLISIGLIGQHDDLMAVHGRGARAKFTAEPDIGHILWTRKISIKYIVKNLTAARYFR